MTDWDELVRTHGPSAYGVAWRILGHAEDVEDVVQELFVECYRVARSRRVEHWRSFIVRLATFRALDKLRQRRPALGLDSFSVIDPQSGPEDEAAARESVAQLRVAVAALPERQATVFCLRYFEELTPSEIARTLAISPNAVSLALHKAREHLRDRFAEVN